jgi:hypothetical protein
MIDGSSSEEAKDMLADAIGILEDKVEYADALCERVQGVQVAKEVLLPLCRIRFLVTFRRMIFPLTLHEENRLLPH